MKLLVVEDEAKPAAYLRKGLTEHGYVVDVAANGEDGLDLARGGDQTPVLFLTARHAVADRVRGLELGADLSLDLTRRRAVRAGRRLELTPKGFPCSRCWCGGPARCSRAR